MSIVARKARGRTVYDVYYRDFNGKQRSKVFPIRKDATRFEYEIMVRKARDDFPEFFTIRKKMLFSELAKKWVEQHSRIYKSPGSSKRDDGALRIHLLPFFGDKDVNRISPGDVQKYLSERINTVSDKTQRKVAPATVNREFEILRKILNDGIKWGDVRTNPCRGTRKFREVKKTVDFLSEPELEALLRSALPKDASFYACAIYTGMRLGELLNLYKSKVDLNQRMITVDIGNEDSKTTKSRKTRYIPINQALYPYLVEAMKTSGEYVFPSKHGTGQIRNDVRKGFHGALLRAGVTRHIRFHDLRHTFASHFVMKGGDLLSLKELLGHSDLQMVQRYAHLAPEHLRKGIERLNFQPLEAAKPI
jgi:integrase